MSKKSPFAKQKALKGIGGDPKSVRKLRSDDLLIETVSVVQSKSFLMAKTFLGSTLTVTPHKSLNSSRGVISEPDLLGASQTKILEGLSDQGVTQVRRITIKKDSTRLPTKHIILTFNSPKFPTTIKARYLNCKIRPYIPNPLRCFQCKRFGHSQTSCRGQFTCSRCASAGHPSTDCTLEPKCINCSQSHASDSKLCPKWMLEKQIQEIKTNKNIFYSEARKLIVPQPSQTYAQVTKPTAISTTTQTDPKITCVICPPLQCLKPISSANPMPSTSSSVSTVSTSSSSTQAHLLPSASSIKPTIQIESGLPEPISSSAATPDNSLNTSASSLSTERCPVPTTFNKFAALSTEVQPSNPLPESAATTSNSEPSKIPQSLPSHVGIIGNEQADSAARSATTDLPLAVPLSDMKRVILLHIFTIWQESWSQQLDNKLHSGKPVIGAWPVMPMRTNVKLTRLRIGHTRFTHRHLLLEEDAPQSLPCKVSYTVQHILVDYPVFNHYHVVFFNSSHLTLSDWEGEIPHQNLFAFIHKIGLLYLI
ncbi:RNase H domain-containing protein [Trichonephila clavipes]|nr:RNase H domain-containing protein [Trichonephila clavipes]